MKTMALRSIVSLLVGVALLLVSCGPRAAAPAQPTTPTPAAPTPVTTPTPATPLTPAAPSPASLAEKPKYGGTLSIIQPSFVDKFDIAVAPG